jgi:integral membrane protein (TIGR01906 family)
MMKNFSRVLTLLVALLVPLAIIMLAVRLLLTPVFLQVEYRMPGFPDDAYGFSMQDRLQWARPSVEYLVNTAGIEYLGDLKFSNGTPIYNERELSHMHDVKDVVQKLLLIWYVDLCILLALGLLAWKGDGWVEYLAGLKWGGFLTSGLLVFLAVFASISFWQFFAWFHSLFFSGDTWLFEFTDTLIRLFPIRFWQDAVIAIVGFSMVAGLVLGFGLKRDAK